jgi:hypothetical protein
MVTEDDLIWYANRLAHDGKAITVERLKDEMMRDFPEVVDANPKVRDDIRYGTDEVFRKALEGGVFEATNAANGDLRTYTLSVAGVTRAATLSRPMWMQ